MLLRSPNPPGDAAVVPYGAYGNYTISKKKETRLILFVAFTATTSLSRN